MLDHLVSQVQMENLTLSLRISVGKAHLTPNCQLLMDLKFLNFRHGMPCFISIFEWAEFATLVTFLTFVYNF